MVSSSQKPVARNKFSANAFIDLDAAYYIARSYTVSVSINLFRQSEDTVPFNRGQVIFRQGQHGALMYAVISGEVDIIVDGIAVDTVQAGGILGEMALID